MNENYKRQVALLIKIMPSIYKITDFAVHGGTAINLFHKNMPRYSVDIDLTYIPIQDRIESLMTINKHLLNLKGMIERAVPGIKVIHKPDVWKLMCTKDGATVKIEVNGTKRGIIEPAEHIMLCEKAQQEFNMGCIIQTVSFSQLYGGKIAAALGRQHPRDLFDCKFMSLSSFDEVKKGFLFCLLGSDKPIVESLHPNPINQTDALENQFEGMSDIPFSYSDYEEARTDLIKMVNENLDDNDRTFLLSFEEGEPDWERCNAGDLSKFPSIKWKVQNINLLKESNPDKFNQGIEKLKSFLF